ncbi:unnamed protein product, partial [Laminaria digitata]
ILKELLKAGVDVQEQDGDCHEQTALHCAAAAGSDAVVRALTLAGASMDMMDTRGRTPLHNACINGHRGVVAFLLMMGACAQGESTEKEPPLHLAAIHNHHGVIEDLLAFSNVSIGRNDMRGRSGTPLHVAAEYGRVEACVALLRGGAEVRPACSSGMTCLDVAASSGHTGQLLQILATAEATQVQRRLCSKALRHAIGSNKADTISDLVALGADVEYHRGGEHPNLHAAVLRCANDATEALLRAGANVEARPSGSTPLHLACTQPLPSMVQLLLHWGADEYAPDSDGSTPSVVVGIHAPSIDGELQPEEFLDQQLAAQTIQGMLEKAPADRSWRRRGWLV